MIRLPDTLRLQLRANARTSLDRQRNDQRFDLPVIKLFNPVGAATWLATELYDDDDTLFGLADLGFGCPELGTFSLAEIGRIRLPCGLFIERDIAFDPRAPLSVWTDTARRMGSIIRAEAELRRGARTNDRLPS